MTDPAAIDLEVIRSRSASMPQAPGAYDINRLIAAVEALRERVLEKTLGEIEWLEKALKEKNRADAAQAHADELAGALRWMLADPNSSINIKRAGSALARLDTFEETPT